MPFGKFETYYQEANTAKNNGDFIAAKRSYLFAGRCLLEAALITSGDMKTALANRARKITDYADSLPVVKTSALPTTPPSSKPEPAVSPPKSDDSEETKFSPAVIPDIGFDDVAGLDDVKQTIRRRVINAMQHPDLYERFKKESGGGVLMYGLPGTGKTMIAKAIAHEVGAKFYSIRCSDIVSKWFGETEKNIKALFDTARKEKTAVIFFDEFEGLAPGRNIKSTVMPRAVNELLSQIDGFTKSENTLLLLAATNRPWDIDSGIVRSGRFSEKLYIPLPDAEARKHILQMNFDGIPVEDDVDYDDLAIKTEGFNGADVSEFCNRCRDFVLERCINIKDSGGDYSDQKITCNDIFETLNNFKSSVNQDDVKRLQKFRDEHDKA